MRYRSNKLAMLLALALALPTFTTAAASDVLTINFTGLTLKFDGDKIFDGGNITYGVATSLGSIDFLLNHGVDPIASLSGNVYADVLIQGVSPIPTGGSVQTSESFIELLSSAGTLLKLSADQMTVSYMGYVDISGIASEVVYQNLPAGLVLNSGSEISILLMGESLTDPDPDLSDGFLNSFGNSLGTGDIEGELVPEPASFAVLLAVGVAGLEIGAWKKRRRRQRLARA